MQAERYSKEYAAEQHWPAAQGQEPKTQQDDRHVIQSLYPYVHRIARQIRSITRANCFIIALRSTSQNPTHMRPPATVARRMRIAGSLCVGVVNAMCRHPCNWTSLEREGATEG